MKAQVYKDPRPVEYFARFHERSRSRDPDWVYEAVRVVTTLYAWIFFRTRGIARREGARRRRGDPRPEPLLVHGPLLPRRLAAAQGALHGQVAAVHAAAAVDLHARRRVPGAARLRRRGRVRHRLGDPRARRHGRHVLRGRALAHRQAVRAAQARHRPAGADDRRAGRPDRDPRLLEGAQLEAPAVPEGHGPLRRPDRAGTASRTRPASSSRQVADEIFAAIRGALRRAGRAGRKGVARRVRELRRAERAGRKKAAPAAQRGPLRAWT